jgi:hypothetical protein
MTYQIPSTKNKVSSDIEVQFIEAAKTKFATLQPEIAQRNKRIADNDQYIYGDKLERMLDIPVGHDLTPINWLRRTVEIHRSQFMGKGFAIDSSYVAEDISKADTINATIVPDPNAKQQQDAERQRLIIENEKKKAYAEVRRSLLEAIIRDNGGDNFWSSAAENASAVGDTIIKAWYDEDKKKYTLQQVETVENFYRLWSKDDYRHYNADCYVYQISKQDSISEYGVSQDVQTTPLGSPLAILHAGNIAQHMSVQPMVTIMEFNGHIEGWKTDGKGNIESCLPGEETDFNAIVVGDVVYQVIDDPKYMPHYYVLPNKLARRRPWGIPDVSNAAAMINLSYIEALSDWRTVSSKVNFPKFKGFGFAPGVQPPKPKPRTIEVLPLADGQDIRPLDSGQSAQSAAVDFRNQINELENQFVREVGISRQLFDMPDTTGNSNPAVLTSMKSISDIIDTKRKLWEPIIREIFNDALDCLAKWDDNIKEVVNDDGWYIKISWPSSLNSDDPSFHSMKLNQFNTGLLSAQTFLEDTGYDKQELDRIREEMEDPTTAAIHGHILGQMAEYKLIPFGTPMPPKVSVNLRGDMTPEQEGNLAQSRGFNDGPFGTTAGPQGNTGLNAQDKVDNQGFTAGGKPGETAINQNPQGQSVQLQGGGTQPPTAPPTSNGGQPASNPGTSPELINGSTANRPGVGIMSQPGSGAPMTSAKGKLKQHAQRRGQ